MMAAFAGQCPFGGVLGRSGGKMFQTEIHIALQSLASDGLTWLMRQITASGYYSSVAALVLIVMFGFHLRKGFLLFQLFAWTGVASELCKALFALPRPFFVDGRVQNLEPTWRAVDALQGQGAPGFFSLPPQSAIDAFRSQGISYGFPSGHVSGSFAMWGGLAVLFRRRWLAWLAPLLIFLTAFTRVYLGVHFLADILGGALLGGVMLALAERTFGGAEGQRRFFLAARLAAAPWRTLVFYALFMFVLPLLLLALGLVPAAFAGFFIGLNAAFALILRQGEPADAGSIPARTARVLIGGFIFGLLDWLLRLGQARLDIGSGSWSVFFGTGIGCFLTFWLTVRLCLRLGLYRKEDPAAD
jgi:membrane-associated phospholipid phosphatase